MESDLAKQLKQIISDADKLVVQTKKLLESAKALQKGKRVKKDEPGS